MSLDEKLKNIKKRCDAATEGPWEKSRNIIYRDTMHEIAYVKGVPPKHSDYEENVQFIAHARTDLPMLLEMVEYLYKFKDAMLEVTTDWDCPFDLDKLEKIAEKYSE